MAAGTTTFDVSTRLSALKHEMKNQRMKALPASMTVQRRPLHHPPVASPFAGADVQKVVYVSSHTPLMSAVKRIKKLLLHVERRRAQSNSGQRKSSAKSISDVVEVSDRLVKLNEEILVKASGRAMQQALRIGEWFRSTEKELLCNVEIRTGNVQTVDDIIDNQDAQENDKDQDLDESHKVIDEETTVLEGGETTMELLGHAEKSEAAKTHDKTASERGSTPQAHSTETAKTKNRKRSKRKRAVYDEDDVPEARLRWVKTVEVAISLKE